MFRIRERRRSAEHEEKRQNETERMKGHCFGNAVTSEDRDREAAGKKQ